MLERWAPIPGFEGFYEVSDAGRVRGLDRTLADGRRWKGRLLAQKTGELGHKSVRLCSASGRHEWHGVHRLVLAAFVGPCPEGHQGAHENGIASNNALNNLRWDTPAGNHSDKARHGTLPVGEKNCLAKLTTDAVLRIRSLRKAGVKQTDIAARFGVTAANISSIITRKTWAHLGDAS